MSRSPASRYCLYCFHSLGSLNEFCPGCGRRSTPAQFQRYRSLHSTHLRFERFGKSVSFGIFAIAAGAMYFVDSPEVRSISAWTCSFAALLLLIFLKGIITARPREMPKSLLLTFGVAGFTLIMGAWVWWKDGTVVLLNVGVALGLSDIAGELTGKLLSGFTPIQDHIDKLVARRAFPTH